MSESSPDFDVLSLFSDQKLVKVCAPMVRYSKLQFRNLVKLYDCDLAFTPMILADSFCLSDKARKVQVTTNMFDSPLITQFAANRVQDFVGAAYLVSPYCNGVDLNCGCPQRWTKELKLGCEMLQTPEVIYDLIRQCRNQISKPFTVSVKLRLLNDINKTVEICKQLEMCGVSFLTVHARTPQQIAGDINKTALKYIKETCSIPIIANGGISSLKDCSNLQNETNCDGVMIANGILTNPGIFSGAAITPIECIQDWLDICYNSTFTLSSYEKEYLQPTFKIPEDPLNLTFQCFHHHLAFMLEKILPKKQRPYFHSFKTFSEVLEFIEVTFQLRPRLFEPEKFVNFVSIDIDFNARCNLYNELKPSIPNEVDSFVYNCEENDGKFFKNKILSTDATFDLSDIFLENS